MAMEAERFSLQKGELPNPPVILASHRMVIDRGKLRAVIGGCQDSRHCPRGGGGGGGRHGR